MDLIGAFVQTVRSIVGMPSDPGAPPVFDRMVFYRAKVEGASANGATLDVRCENPDVGGLQKVSLRVGVPGAVAVVQVGSVVLLGWEAGDPSRPYCAPLWEQGAGVSKLTFNCTALELAGNTYSLPKWELYLVALKAFITALKAAASFPNIVAAATAFETALGTGSDFKSTKVKNG